MKRVLTAILVLVLSSTVIGQEAEEKAGQCFEKYLGFLQAGDYVAAAEMWSLWDRTYSEHLGINYDNCPVKLESGTLLGRQMDALRDPATTVDVLNIEISRGFSATVLAAVTASALLTSTLKMPGNHNWLAR
jgi:hypothetical protein